MGLNLFSIHIVNDNFCSIFIGLASHAQTRIWLDERIRFDPHKPSVAIYNMPFVYRLSPQHTLSLNQLRKALQLIVMKHLSLRTALIYNTEKNVLIQKIIQLDDDNKKQLFTFIENTYENDKQLNDIIYNEKSNSKLFDLSQGLVFRCHIVYYKQISSDGILSHNDILIFNFHHALFDYPSMNIFLHDLDQAYKTEQIINDDDDDDDDDTHLRYIDCE